MRPLARVAPAGLLGLVLGCSGAPRIDAQAWTDADALFRGDPRWLGADGAYSVDLGDGRVLWLFGDTFVATSDAASRTESTMIRNSVGLQLGYDPTDAEITFAWREIDAAPSSFFPEAQDGSWSWPGDGELVDGQLFVFLMRVEAAEGGLGFAVTGSELVRVADPSAAPEAWQIETLGAPPAPAGVVIGSATVLRHGDHVYAWSADESRPDHPVYLARVEVAALLAGELEAVRWYDGATWADPAAARPIFDEAQTEFTVHRDSARDEWIAIQTMGFGSTQIGVRSAPAPEGPWTRARSFWRPPESDTQGLLVYAAKAHPELDAGGALALTYVANAEDFGSLVNDASIYFPRFVSAQLAPAEGAG